MKMNKIKSNKIHCYKDIKNRIKQLIRMRNRYGQKNRCKEYLIKII